MTKHLARSVIRPASIASALVVAAIALAGCGSSGATDVSALRPWPAAPTNYHAERLVDGPVYNSAAQLAARGPDAVQITFARKIEDTDEAGLQGQTDQTSAKVAVWQAIVTKTLTTANLKVGDTVLVSAMSGVSPVLDAIGVRQSAIAFLYPTPVSVNGETLYAIAGVDQGLIPVQDAQGTLAQFSTGPVGGLGTVAQVQKSLTN